jgi:DNA mismatch repair protein MutS
MTVPFQSILFPSGTDEKTAAAAPDFFGDLNLDQIVNAIIVGKQDYDLKPFFFAPLSELGVIKYRQAIFRDLEDKALVRIIRSFAGQMGRMREQLSLGNKLYYKYQKQRLFLDGVSTYCDLIAALANDLAQVKLQSEGLVNFRDYLTSYSKSDRFGKLLEHTRKLRADLAAIQYCIRIKWGGFTVRKPEAESDYSAAIDETFAKFRQGAVKDYRVQFTDSLQMNHIEAKVLEFVARLYPEIFSDVENFCASNGDFLDSKIKKFDREIQFYIAYLDLLQRLSRRGLKFCYPVVSDQFEGISGNETFDLALADKLNRKESTVVSNDFCLSGKEHVIVVTGPNQGGKTTFARAFGQMHYLAALGLLVPGREARLLFF